VRGEGTRWLADRKMGDVLDVLGPLGRGFDVSGDRILVAGGGIGVPPLLFAAKRAKETHAVLGFRTARAVIMPGDFNECCSAVQITTDDGSIGRPGFVDGTVRAKLEAVSFDRVLACGPKPMLKAVARVCSEMGVPLQVSLEERMACGVGACLGCACKTKGADGYEHYRHVCSDGPVFNAEEVVWDD
jgi:dihydroorotate dehydrogenase electron transfer subunit